MKQVFFSSYKILEEVRFYILHLYVCICVECFIGSNIHTHVRARARDRYENGQPRRNRVGKT